MSKRVIKRTNYTEPFFRGKLKKSVHAVCLSVSDFGGAAEVTAEEVVQQIEDWLEDKIEVTSQDVRLATAEKLHVYSPAAALVYSNHMDVS